MRGSGVSEKVIKKIEAFAKKLEKGGSAAGKKRRKRKTAKNERRVIKAVNETLAEIEAIRGETSGGGG
jgi:hypothetical protein